MRRIHIAILECDTPIEAIRTRYGTYGNIIKRLMLDSFTSLPAVSRSNVEPIFTSWDVVHARTYPMVDDVDAIVLTGSKFNSFDDDEWILQLLNYVRTFHGNAQKPIVGICFGHQIVARALGGKVQRSPGGWETAVCSIQLSDEGKRLFGQEELKLHQMHHDAVLSTPDGLINLGTSPSCGIQGLYSDKRVITLQAHPEFDAFIMETLLDARHELGIFDNADFEEATHRAAGQHDGHLVASAIWQFLLASG